MSLQARSPQLSQSAIKKLFSSFEKLEQSILLAKQALLAQDPLPFTFLKRISNYEDVLTKQRRLATSLCKHMSENNWPEVSRHVKLINALSEMLHDDARHMIQGVLRGFETRPLTLV